MEAVGGIRGHVPGQELVVLAFQNHAAMHRMRTAAARMEESIAAAMTTTYAAVT